MSKLDEVDQQNGLTEQEILEGLEYLVLGHFKRNERDVKGIDKMVWLSIDDLEHASLEDGVLDAALEKWEQESAQMREKARGGAT